MLSEAINLIKRSLMASSLVALVACSDSNERAGELLSQSQAIFENGRYEEVLQLLDSLDKTYPEAVDLRRESMKMRPKVIEQLSVKQISVTDSMLAIELARGEELCKGLVRVDNPIEPYMVGASEKGVTFSSTGGLHSRLSPDGMLFLTATNNKPCGAVCVKLQCDGEEVVSPVIDVDGERNYKYAGNEVITFTPEEGNQLAEFVVTHKDYPISIVFTGDKGRMTMKMGQAQVEAMVQTYETAKVLTSCRLLNLEKQRFEKQLAVARNQIARTISE